MGIACIMFMLAACYLLALIGWLGTNWWKYLLPPKLGVITKLERIPTLTLPNFLLAEPRQVDEPEKCIWRETVWFLRYQNYLDIWRQTKMHQSCIVLLSTPESKLDVFLPALTSWTTPCNIMYHAKSCRAPEKASWICLFLRYKLRISYKTKENTWGVGHAIFLELKVRCCTTFSFLPPGVKGTWGGFRVQ